MDAQSSFKAIILNAFVQFWPDGLVAKYGQETALYKYIAVCTKLVL